MKAAEAGALVNAARTLLNTGDAVGAARVLSPLIKSLKADPDALHLMGLIKKAQNDLPEAERYLRSAIAQSLSDGGYYNDLGVVLQARGAFADAQRVYRAALALMPKAEAVRVNLVRCLMAQGELGEAEREARAYIAANPGAEAWTLLSQVHRAQERHELAMTAAGKALEYAPTLRGLRHNYATALERAGRPQEALPVYEDLVAQKLDSADLALSFSRALFADNRRRDAETVLTEALRQWPQSAPLHSAMARMQVLGGAGEAATAQVEAAIARAPDDLGLRLACADALHRGGFLVKALRVLDEALRAAPETPALLTAYGFMLDELGRPEDALTALRRAAALTPDSRIAQRNLLSTLMRARRPDEALTLARALRQGDADEQFLITCESQALRMLGDPASEIFLDYDRYVRAYEVGAPRGYFTAENFNASMAEALRRQHRVNAHPLDQPLSNYSQTARTLLTLEDPPVKAFLGTVDTAVRDYISRLRADAADPVGRRRTDRFRFSGLWSTKLMQGGYQPNHVHDHGWISSAYFVSILPKERPVDPRNGWLKFGEPTRPTAGCEPQKLLEPRTGLLVLFPSYLWHGVVPFEGSERLSLSFDVIPA